MDRSDPAPIALFVYNRANHTRLTVEALLKNPESAASDLTVFADGPKASASPAEISRVRDTRAYLETITGFKSVNLILRDQNRGLAPSIITGVTSMLEKSDRVIVLEDDLISSPFFLKYMNEGLHRYSSDDRIASIHGYALPIPELPETYFLKGADCWGWATWRRAWRHFESDGALLLKQIKNRGLGREFDLDGSYPYVRMLRDQVKGKNNSWAIRWQASAFLKNMVSLHPGRSLISNRGFDGTGAHCTASNQFDVTLTREPIILQAIPVVEDPLVKARVSDFYRSHRLSLWARVLKKLKIRE